MENATIHAPDEVYLVLSKEDYVELKDCLQENIVALKQESLFERRGETGRGRFVVEKLTALETLLSKL